MSKVNSVEYANCMLPYFKEWDPKFAATQVIDELPNDITTLNYAFALLQEPMPTYRHKILYDKPEKLKNVNEIEEHFPGFVKGVNTLARDYNEAKKHFSRTNISEAQAFCNRALDIRDEYLGDFIRIRHVEHESFLCNNNNLEARSKNNYIQDIEA